MLTSDVVTWWGGESEGVSTGEGESPLAGAWLLVLSKLLSAFMIINYSHGEGVSCDETTRLLCDHPPSIQHHPQSLLEVCVML